MELMVFLMKKGVCDEFGLNADRLSKNLLSGKCVVCLPNEEIFAGLARMRYEKPSTKLTFYKAFFSTQWNFLIHTILHSFSAKRTSWNEFSSAMASALISLSSVRDVAKEAEAQVLAQGDDVQEHVAEEVATDVGSPASTSPSPSSPRVLDTCSTLVLRVEGLENDKAAQQLEIVKLKARVKKLEKINKVEGRHADKQAEIYNIDLDHSSKVLSMQEDDTEVQEAVEI
nr:hypothetical protein [Tanacetum cinerariifolium]